MFPPEIDAAIKTGGALPSDLSAGEKRAIVHPGAEYKHAAYAVQLGTRPQTMYALNDSPVGLAAFQLDHDPKSYELIARSWTEKAYPNLIHYNEADRGGHYRTIPVTPRHGSGRAINAFTEKARPGADGQGGGEDLDHTDGGSVRPRPRERAISSAEASRRQ